MDQKDIDNNRILNTYDYEKKVAEIFGDKDFGKKELYNSSDESNIPIINNKIGQFTYFTPGYSSINIGELFSAIRKSNKSVFRFPGAYSTANNVTNRIDGLSHSFNWRLEAIRHLKTLQFFLRCNFPVECWDTQCYGFLTLSSTLYALASGTREAVELRGQLFISDSEATAILEKLKLIIVSAPLLSTNRMLNKSVNPLIEKGLLTAATIPVAINIGQAVLCNSPLQPINFLYPPLMNYFKHSIASCLSYYGMKYRTSIDEKKGEALQLLYDLSKEKRKINATLIITWRTEDNLIDTVQPEDLITLYHVFGNIVGIGSPYDDHLHDDMRQKRVINWVRKEHNMSYYDVPELLTAGKKYFNAIMRYHEDHDWAGLKQFTEDPIHYTL